MRRVLREGAEAPDADRTTWVVRAIVAHAFPAPAGPCGTATRSIPRPVAVPASDVSDVSDVSSAGAHSAVRFTPQHLVEALTALFAGEEGEAPEWANPRSVGWELSRLRIEPRRDPHSQRRERYRELTLRAVADLARAHGLVDLPEPEPEPDPSTAAAGIGSRQRTPAEKTSETSEAGATRAPAAPAPAPRCAVVWRAGRAVRGAGLPAPRHPGGRPGGRAPAVRGAPPGVAAGAGGPPRRRPPDESRVRCDVRLHDLLATLRERDVHLERRPTVGSASTPPADTVTPALRGGAARAAGHLPLRGAGRPVLSVGHQRGRVRGAAGRVRPRRQRPRPAAGADRPQPTGLPPPPARSAPAAEQRGRPSRRWASVRRPRSAPWPTSWCRRRPVGVGCRAWAAGTRPREAGTSTMAETDGGREGGTGGTRGDARGCPTDRARERLQHLHLV